MSSTELMNFKYTWWIFKPDFLENRGFLYFLFDWFSSYVESPRTTNYGAEQAKFISVSFKRY